MIEIKALQGDNSDNIPGVQGVGPKTAGDLIKKYNNIENLYNNIESKDLKHYYNEFTNLKCEYDDCNHVHEDVKHCSVKKAIQQGKIDSKRYENYIKIYEELKQKEKRIYK